MEADYKLKSCFATLPKTVRGLPVVLGNDPHCKTFLYCNGNSVIIRDIVKPSVCDIYTEHSTHTTVAKYSASGFYIASADVSGKVRIWDTTQKEHVLKKEYQPVSGAIRDIAWCFDNQRLAVVGEGRERFDTGTSNGSLAGQSKAINSVDFRPSKPFRLVTASEDNTIALFEGAPFKFKNSFQVHTRFAHCARFSPNGATFASAAADGKVFLFDASEGSLLGELTENSCKGNAHAGGIYGLSWSGDGREILTASGDKTCKVWDVETKSVVTTFTFGDTIEDQQLGCLWQNEFLLSVSLGGFIYYLDRNSGSVPQRIVKGHNRPITAAALSHDKQTIYSSDSEGNITSWSVESGDSDRIEPKFHKAQVQQIAAAKSSLATVAMDDTIAFSTEQQKQTSKVVFDVEQCKLNSQPRSVAISEDGSLTIIGCFKEIIVMRNHRSVSSLPAAFEPSCVALHPANNLIAVGGHDNKVHIYQLNNDQLSQINELTLHGQITDAKFSGDGKFLAACDAARRVVPFTVPDFKIAASKEWTFHTARVNCLAWSPNNRHIASGSLDTNIIVWDLERSGEHPLIIKGAHTMNQITSVIWRDEKTIISTGQDSNVKQWILTI